MDKACLARLTKKSRHCIADNIFYAISAQYFKHHPLRAGVVCFVGGRGHCITHGSTQSYGYGVY